MAGTDPTLTLLLLDMAPSVGMVLQALGYSVTVYVRQDNSVQTKRALLDTAESLRCVDDELLLRAPCEGQAGGSLRGANKRGFLNFLH